LFRLFGVDTRLAVQRHDARQALPFPDAHFGGCFSHLFFIMELTEAELLRNLAEVLRVLKPNRLNIYSSQNDHYPHFR